MRLRRRAAQGAFVETFSCFDGGKTWSDSHLPLLRELLAKKDLELAEDPWVADAPDGTAYCPAAAGMKRATPGGDSRSCSIGAAIRAGPGKAQLQRDRSSTAPHSW